MKLTRALSARRPAPDSAFTMVEIAFSLAIIGFALIAIIGVLPLGLNVQKDNRRETIINQDANYFLEAIRGGGRGLDDLTNYVTSITNFWQKYNADGTRFTGPSASGIDAYTNATMSQLGYPANDFGVNSGPNYVADYRLTNGLRIIGVLSTPKYVPSRKIKDPPGTYYSNYVVAYIRAISGGAIEKYPQTNAIVRDMAFSYRMVVELTPFRPGSSTNLGFSHPDWTNFLAAAGPANETDAIDAIDRWTAALTTNGSPVLTNYTTTALGSNDVFLERANAWLLSRQTTPNLYDLRLLFRWPLLPGGRLGNGRQTYRAMVSGGNTNAADPDSPLFFLSSQSYVRTP